VLLLQGIRVIDLSRFIAGPYCGAILADLGAEVIRVEPVGGGEDRRLVPVARGGEGALFLQLNRNKLSVALDINAPAGRAALERLIATAQVVLTNMPPQGLKKQNLEYATLRAIKPDLIVTNLSAFGMTGRLSNRTGFDGVAQGMSGAAYLGGKPGRPARSASSYVDYGTGLAAALGTVAAVMHHMRTGEGQEVQASLLGTAMAFLNAMHIEEAVLRTGRKPYGNRSPNSGPSDMFPTADGTIVIQVVGNAMFRRLATVIGRPDLPQQKRFATDSARGRNGAALSRMVATWTRARTSAEALDLLERAGVPGGPIYTPRDALDDPGIAEAGIFNAMPFPGADAPLPLAGLPLRFGRLEAGVRTRPPLAGEHTERVLRGAGLSEQDIAVLLRDGVAGVSR
jgi:crotonobetainyl-CoA:carnitine CoA-transferase CaiB-like acyl-CoA transferase